MQIRCFRCGWAFNLSRETMAAALANAEATGATHHVEHCPRCRQVLKISIEQIRRLLPLAARTIPQTQEKETAMTTPEMPAQEPMPTPSMPEPMPAPPMPMGEPMMPAMPAAKKPAKKAAKKPAKKAAKKSAKKAAKKPAKKAAKKAAKKKK